MVAVLAHALAVMRNGMYSAGRCDAGAVRRGGAVPRRRRRSSPATCPPLSNITTPPSVRRTRPGGAGGGGKAAGHAAAGAARRLRGRCCTRADPEVEAAGQGGGQAVRATSNASRS